jgi:isopenicillin-N epimerase
MQLPHPSAHSIHWGLDPEVVFLNHGSFGACPRVVMHAQQQWQLRLEREPVLLLHRELEGHLAVTRQTLGQLLSCDPDDLALVSNATQGVNTVLRSLRFEPDEELLTIDHEYNASRNALDFVADLAGAKVVIAEIPFPLESEEQVVESVLAKVTDRTRLLLIDHITSPTGLVLPVQRIVRELEARGVDTLVDGAHGPGMLPINLQELGAAYYTGNCHKWLCTPKGSALLYVRRDRQDMIRPLSISHGANSQRKDTSRFRLEFDFTGTYDPAAHLCVTPAVRFLSGLFHGGIEGLQRHNRQLALSARQMLCERLSLNVPAPDGMIGSLASIPLPATAEPTITPHDLDPLHVRLMQEFSVEVPVMRWSSPQLRLLRISPQAYNTMAQYEYLADCLQQCGIAGS